MDTTNTTQDTISTIDAAIAAAKEKRANRTASAMKTSKEDRDAARKAAAETRAAARAAKRAAKASAPARVAHMTKVEKAGAKLPSLGDAAQNTFNNVTSSLSSEQISALALHLQHFNRVQATTRALSAGELKVGQVVRITGGEPKFIGLTGTIETLRRIRCFVAVPGVKKPIYLFVSEVTALEGGQELPASEPMSVSATG